MNSAYNCSLDKFRYYKKDYYDTKSDCEKDSKKYVQTNPRYPKFDQILFNAADETDITKYALLCLRYIYSNSISGKITDKPKIFKLYKEIDYISITNTFKYMFDMFKKGIFIIINNNKLVLFMPFSNANYRNHFVKQLYLSESEKELLKDPITNKKILQDNLIMFKQKYYDQYKYRGIEFNRSKWYANDCLLRNEYDSFEGELTDNMFKNLFEELLKNRKIPDVEIFINNRDFPILKRDQTEPYNNLFDGDKVKINKDYKFSRMAPIFSKCITDKYADILLPTNDDWQMASDKFFTHGCSDSYHSSVFKDINHNWKTKKNMCIFRGTATGCSIDIETNMRLKAADISFDHPDILDAGVIEWNARAKKIKGKPISIIDPTKFRFKLANKITNIEKSNYKYILNIDGHVSAFRLSSELNMSSVVLIVGSKNKMWYSDKLIPYIHYIPIKSDLDDLISQIRWCIDNDDKCKIIADNAKVFFNTYLTKDGIFDYLQSQLQIVHQNRNIKNLLHVKYNTKNIAIISCFRDKGDGVREGQRRKFIQLINSLFEPYCKFHIYIIEQSADNNPFNIGKLKNIGFKIAESEHKFNNYIFTDIDTIPDYDLMNYMVKPAKYTVALAIRGTRYSDSNLKNKKPFLGALLGFNGAIFNAINGYPNNFWGWGGEDDALLNRLCQTKYDTVYYPKKGTTIDIEENEKMTTLNIVEKVKTKDLVKDSVKYEKLYEDLKSWSDNGLNSLNYKVIKWDELNANTTQIVVDLMKKGDEIKFPHLFPGPTSNYKKIYNEVKMMWGNVKIVDL